MDRKELEEVIASALEKAGHQSCYPDEHKIFISAWIAKENRKQELWQSIKKHTIIWALTGALLYFGYLAWIGFKDMLRVELNHSIEHKETK